jgi:hypothetical protein
LSNPAADEREVRLKKLSHILHNIDRRDMVGTMGLLSVEFQRHMRLAEDGVSGNEIGGAEGHWLIAESIHDTLKTLEVKQRSL